MKAMTPAQARKVFTQIAKSLPAAEVEKILGRLRKDNPEGEDLATLVTRWHWGRYDRALLLEAPREKWQPAQGFALGELHALTIGDQRFECPEGKALLCASGEGAASLFVVPVVTAAAGPISRVEYIAEKGKDREPVIYGHNFDAPYPVASLRNGAVCITRGQSRFRIDLERGIVG